MRRKLLSVVLCVCMMLTMVPFAFAEENPSSGGSGSASGASSEGITTEEALKTAITNAASENKTVTLDGDITLTSQLTISTPVTLNGNGHTITATGTKAWTGNNGKHLLLITSNDVTINDTTFNCANLAYDVHVYTATGVTFKNVTIKNSVGAALGVNASQVTATGTFTTECSTWKNSVNICWGSSITDTRRTCSFDARNATLTGVRSVYADANDVNNAGSISQFTFKSPTNDTSWTNNPVSDNNAISYVNYNNAVAKIGDTCYATVTDAVTAANSNTTILLIKNTVESVIIPAGKNLTLDLNGKELKSVGTTILNNGTLSICDSLKTGSIISTANVGVSSGHNSNTTIEYANVTGREGAVITSYSTNATITIKDGVFTATDNAVIAGNGNSTDENKTARTTANTINISGGTFNGQIVSSGYIACGIYAPWKDKITVSGGTFNITGGAGIVARGGNVTITGGEFNTTGNATGKVGDNPNQIPSSTLVFDSNTTYPGKEDSSKITVQGGKFKSDVDAITLITPTDGDTNTRIEVTGGYFTSDPTTYVKTDYTAVETTEPGYNYEVTTASSTKAEVATAAPDVQLPENLKTDTNAQALQTALAQATDLVDGDGLTAAAKTIANSNNVTEEQAITALKKDGIISETTTTSSVRIVVQTYMDVDITALDTTKNTLTLDITPMYRTIATTEENNTNIKVKGDAGVNSDANAVEIIKEQKLTINKPVTVKIPLPTAFATLKEGGTDYNPVYVQHKGHEYTATVTAVSDGTTTTQDADATTSSQKFVATFTNPDGFSTFTITTEQTAVAILNGVNYTSFQDAVNAANNGDVITALKDNLSATMSGSSRTITVKNGTASDIKVTINGTEKTLAATTGSETFTYTRPSSGSGSTSTTYNVNVNAATNGTVAADKKTASKGTTVTVTATPSKGYVVDAVKVVDKDGKDVAVTVKNGKYVFTMPGSAVTVTATFKAETPAPSSLPFTDVKSGDWFYNAVKYAYEQGLMNGTSATTFAPNGTMNRAMIVTVLYRLEKSPAVTAASKFTDVPAGQWYSDAVAWAAANNIVNGYDETTFGPMNAVTREQMAAILYRYEQYKGMDTVTLEENLNKFPDKDKISAYAVPALQWAVGQKIINGNADGTLNPTGTATRAQVAQIFTNLLNK